MHVVKILPLYALFTIFSTSAFAQPTPVVCMPFNGNAQDVSGNNHHGAVTGAILTTDRFGYSASSYFFDGVDDEIQIIDPLSTYFPDDELTIVFWAKAMILGMNSPFLLVPNDNADRLNIHIHYDHNGVPSTFWDYGNIGGGGRMTIQSPYQTVWDHYAFVVSGSQGIMRIYKNGVLKSQKTNISFLTNRNRNLNIGGGISGATNCHFKGMIDDVQLFDVALTTSEILANYNTSSSCITTGINESELLANSISIYPNPSQDQINISLPGTNVVSGDLDILDVNGRIVYSYGALNITENNVEVDIRNLEAGVYFIRINTPEFVHVSKLIKY